jgi:hypothetical protein
MRLFKLYAAGDTGGGSGGAGDGKGGDGGAGAGGGAGDGKGDAGKGNGAGGAGGGDMQPVPYPVFKETNEKYRQALGLVDSLKAQLAEAQKTGARVPELEGTLTKAKADTANRVTLVRAGVHSDAALDYLLGRYGVIDKPPALPDWIAQMRKDEPAFFGTTGGGAAGDGKGTDMKGNPDKGTDGKGTGDAPPITKELIRAMTIDEYAKRRAEIQAFLALEKRQSRLGA